MKITYNQGPGDMRLTPSHAEYLLTTTQFATVDGVTDIKVYTDGYWDGDQLLNSLIVNIWFGDDCDAVAAKREILAELGLGDKTPFACSQEDPSLGYICLHYAID